MNAIVDRFEQLAPARPLVHLPATSRTLTAHDLEQMRLGCTSVLRSIGIGPGHVILSISGNRPGFLSLLLAAWSLDAAVMPVDEDTRDEDVSELAECFGVAAIVGARQRMGPSARDLDDALALTFRPTASWREYADVGLFKVTSGSTGVPKAVAVPPSALDCDAEHIVEAMDIRPDDTQIAVIPLSHAYGFGNLVLPLVRQGTAIVLRDTFVPQAVMADARRFGARILPGVPYMFRHFEAHPPEGGWPASLTWLISAGAMLSPDVIRAFHDRFGLKVHTFYGASETGGIAFDPSDTVDDVPAVGWPMPGVAIELCADDDVPHGYQRVRVRGNAVARGYVEDAGATAFNGSFLTGDYGKMLDDGRLLLAGRVSTFINVAGRKVQPGEVEQELRQMDGVIDARVLAVSDRLRGEQVAAVVAGRHVTPASVRRFCADRLAAHKIPRLVVVVSALPLTQRGKVDERALRALVESGGA